MTKRQKQKPRHRDPFDAFNAPEISPPRPAKKKDPLSARTEAQRRMISSIRHNKITFGVGPAGVGKTYVAARVASEMLLSGEIERIYLTRPAVEAGRPIGFLKGDMEEKMAPYIAAYGQGFNDGLGRGHFEYLLRVGQIEIVPLNFMQGRSFDEPSIVLFDEAQNSTPDEMKMFLTRLGEGATYFVDGDPAQTMIEGKSGLIDGLSKTRYLNAVGVVEFSRADIVRSGLVREILDAYDAGTECKTDGVEESNDGLPRFITG